MTESLAKSLGVKAEYVKTSWSNLMNDFVAKCDIGVGGVSPTLERQKRAFFTQAYMIDGKTPIVRCDDVNKYQTVAQIDQPATRVIVNPGGTNERFAKQYFPHANLTVYPDNVTIFKQILAGKADVMVTDASETLLQQKLNPGFARYTRTSRSSMARRPGCCRAATWCSSSTWTNGCISRGDRRVSDDLGQVAEVMSRIGALRSPLVDHAAFRETVQIVQGVQINGTIL